jgi:hypothetical protein
MAQGTLKSKKLTTATAKTPRRATVLGPKKGARTIAPRKQVLVRSAKMTKVGFCLFVCLFVFVCVCVCVCMRGGGLAVGFGGSCL